MILTSFFFSLKFNFCNLLQYSFLNLSSLSIYQANSIYIFREIIFLGDFLANFYNFHFILFCRIRIWFTYRYDALIFVSGPQNVFLVEVWNRNNDHGKFCIPRLRLGYKKNLWHYLNLCLIWMPLLYIEHHIQIYHFHF